MSHLTEFHEVATLDPDVADLAPENSVLTAYDQEHSLLICGCWTPRRTMRTGGKLRS